MVAYKWKIQKGQKNEVPEVLHISPLAKQKGLWALWSTALAQIYSFTNKISFSFGGKNY